MLIILFEKETKRCCDLTKLNCDISAATFVQRHLCDDIQLCGDIQIYYVKNINFHADGGDASPHPLPWSHPPPSSPWSHSPWNHPDNELDRPL